MWTRKELKEKAKIAFKANYWPSVLAAIVIGLFAGGGSGGGSSSARNSSDTYNSGGGLSFEWILVIAGIILVVALISAAIKIIIGNALIVGGQRMFVFNETQAEKPSVSELVFAFKSGFWSNISITLFLKDLYVFLWGLLFIIPGIIKAYEYRMIPYLLAEDPSIDRKEAFAKSKEMMDGQKMNAFLLDLSFIPWVFAILFTCGIAGIFYVTPYIYQTDAELYITLKNANSPYNTYEGTYQQTF